MIATSFGYGLSGSRGKLRSIHGPDTWLGYFAGLQHIERHRIKLAAFREDGSTDE